MQKIYVNISVLVVIILLPMMTFAQWTARVQTFLDDFSTHQAYLMESGYAEDAEHQAIANRWFEDNVLANASVCNECDAVGKDVKDYHQYLKTLQKRGSYISEYKQIGEPIVDKNTVTARVQKTVKSNGNILHQANYVFIFLYTPSSDRIQLKAITPPSNLTRPSYCNAPKPKLALPLLTMGLGVTAFASSYYFQSISDKHYQNYQSSFPLPQSDIDYLRSNQNHHTDLALKYSGIAVTAIGTGYLLVKVFSHRSKRIAFLPIITPKYGNLAFSYQF